MPKLKSLPNTVVLSIQQAAIHGTPDLLLCVRGVFVALELKKDAASKPTKLQEWNINRIRQAVGIATVVHPDNFEAVFKLLTVIANGGGAELPLHKFDGPDKTKVC